MNQTNWKQMHEDQISDYFLTQLATSGEIEIPSNPAWAPLILALAADLVKAFAKNEKQIAADINYELEQMQADSEEDKAVIFDFSLSGKMNFDQGLATATFKHTAKRQVKFAHDLEEERKKANQPELPGIA